MNEPTRITMTKNKNKKKDFYSTYTRGFQRNKRCGYFFFCCDDNITHVESQYFITAKWEIIYEGEYQQ